MKFNDIKVLEDGILIDLLEKYISHKDAKRLLSNSKIKINGLVTTKFDFNIKKGDTIKINNYRTNVDVLYEDNEILILNKPYNFLTIKTVTNDSCLFSLASNYVKESNKKNKIFIVHRLDRETSGIVLFAKNEFVKNKLQNNWEDVIRKYRAVVVGKITEEGVLKNNLKEDKNHFVRVSKDGKLAITEFKRIRFDENYSWVDINIKTGRKNQIRVQLSNIGHPIKGDYKYGDKKLKRMFLHASYIELINPVTKKLIKVKCISKEV